MVIAPAPVKLLRWKYAIPIGIPIDFAIVCFSAGLAREVIKWYQFV